MAVEGRGRCRAIVLALAVTILCRAAAGDEPLARQDPPRPAVAQPAPANDDQTFRPTVLVRKGRSQGTGSVIASVPDETLILTVAHVVLDPGELTVELHRYNLGLERGRPAASGTWPKVLNAKVLALDRPADLAIVRISGMVALPYVAQLALDEPGPAPGTVVTSLGIDWATHLSSWQAHIVREVNLDTFDEGHGRPFLLIDQRPEHGRSGGGLFLTDGRLVGVCVGRTETSRGRHLGVFASSKSIERLVAEHKLAGTLERSSRLHANLVHDDPLAPRPGVTTTDHRTVSPSPRQPARPQPRRSGPEPARTMPLGQ